MPLQHHDIFQIIKSDFCNLFSYKQRGDTLEVITSVSTVTDCHVSIFVSYKNGKYIISDGAWISKAMYNNELSEDSASNEIIDKLVNQYIAMYQIKKVVHLDSHTYYYKTTEREEMISALVFEVANFVAAVANTQSLFYVDEVEKSQNSMFKTEVNNFIKENYTNDTLGFNKSIEDYRIKSQVKFNAVISIGGIINLVMYVSGSNNAYFTSSTCKAIANFEIIDKSLPNANYFKKVTILNNHSGGYDIETQSEYFTYLQEIAKTKPILFHGQRNQILEHIPIKNMLKK